MLERNPIILDIDIIVYAKMALPSGLILLRMYQRAMMAWCGLPRWSVYSHASRPARRGECPQGMKRGAKISQGWQVLLGQLQYCRNTAAWA